MIGDIVKGSDKEVPFQLKDSNGDPIDLSSLTGMIVVLSYKKSGHILRRYSNPSKSGFGDVDFYNASNGEFLVRLQSATTENASEGQIVAEVKTFENDSDWNNNSFTEIFHDLDVGQIVKGTTTYLSP